ncbi:MAG: tetratricopeptide repeat protein, partial [Planctomycetes bacterium]|nr:tetratricopeptide repeat protein [Planctomycetota bacterium]
SNDRLAGTGKERAQDGIFDLPAGDTESTERIEKLRREVAANPDGTGMNDLLARHLARAGQTSPGALLETVDACNGVLERRPDDVEALYSKASALSGLEDHGTALELINKAVKLSPDRAELVVLRAEILSSLDEHNRALDDAYKAVELDPGSARAYYVMGTIYDSHGASASPYMAIACYTRALERRPEFFEAMYYRTLQRYVVGQENKAVSDFRTIAAKAPDGSAWSAKARSYLRGITDRKTD